MTLRRRCPSSMIPARAGSRAFRQVWVCTCFLASHYCSPRRASRVRVLFLRAFSSESFNTTIHGCWMADARPLQSRMIRVRKEEMLLNFLVRYSLLVIAPLKEFAEDPSVFTIMGACAFPVIFSHVSRWKSSLASAAAAVCRGQCPLFWCKGCRRARRQVITRLSMRESRTQLL